ncbi:MAG: choice-of-anchor L domain-containing protein [Flavobacteriales bacterium]
MKAVLFFTVLMLVATPNRAQIPTLTNASASAAAAAYALVGPNVTVSNAAFSGVASQLAVFTDGTDKLGFENGVVLMTCDAAFVDNPNCGNLAECVGQYILNSDASDPDLNQINGNSTPKDAAVLEFDFATTGTSVTFSYVFASNEYHEWVGSSYNDAFGFFISGPGINGPFSNNAINIATIGGSPVSINTVNEDTNAGSFIFNECCTVGQQNVNIESTWVFAFDGQTVIMNGTLDVQCNTTYHAKIAICNTADHWKQSAVFIRNGTLSSSISPPGPLTIAPSPVCAGEEITLAVQGDPSWNYTWSTGQSGVGLQTVTTIASLGQNSYSVTAEYLSGCSLASASPAAMLTVHDPQNSPPQCLGVNGTGTYTATIQVGEQTCFTIPTSDAPNEAVEVQVSGSLPGGTFSDNNAHHETGTFCWTPNVTDVGFHTLDVLLSDNNVCGLESSICAITLKVVCDFCPVRVYYERRIPESYPLPELTVAGESITAGYSVDPTQENGLVVTGNDPVEFRAPYIDLRSPALSPDLASLPWWTRIPASKIAMCVARVGKASRWIRTAKVRTTC